MQTKSSDIPELCHQVLKKAGRSPNPSDELIRERVWGGGSILKIRDSRNEGGALKLVVYFRDAYETTCTVSLEMQKQKGGKYDIGAINMRVGAQLPGERRSPDQKGPDGRFETLEDFYENGSTIHAVRLALEDHLYPQARVPRYVPPGAGRSVAVKSAP